MLNSNLIHKVSLLSQYMHDVFLELETLSQSLKRGEKIDAMR